VREPVTHAQAALAPISIYQLPRPLLDEENVERIVMKGLEGSKLGRYELRFRVAQGGMSEVYLGYDRRVRRYVAIKVLYGSNEPFVRRFEREALAIGALAHEHILPLYDFGEQRPWYYLVMPFVEGGTLRDYLARRERLTLEEAGSFLEQIASALQHAHDQGVLHRDVKPSNILLRPDGHAYLADFGLAKAKLDAASLSHSGEMIGTPEYMAPEQSNGQNDQRSDIYSLGVILYQMLTGRVPFTADTPVGVTLKHLQTPPLPPSQFNSDIPLAIEEVILTALAKVPEERYQEASELAAAFNKTLFRKRTHELGKEAYTLVAAQESTIQQTYSITDKTRAIIDKITTQLDFPSTRPQRFPLKGEATAFLPYATELHRKQKPHAPLIITILSLVITLSVTLALLFTWQFQQSQQTGHQQVIPTTIRVAATATAITHQHAQATLAAQARAQAVAGITTAIGAGNILYYNDLEQKSSGWLDDGHQCYFSPQGYHVHASLAHAVAWCYTSQYNFSNIIITVQTQLLRGGFGGIIFRLNPYSKAFYALEIDNDGDYRFQRALGNDPTSWLTLIDWTHTGSAQTGYGTTNTLLAIAENSNFTFYINQQLVLATYTDPTYKTGLIGLLVGGDTQDGTEAIFNHLIIFQKK
jgi:serine/threonine protein kinase